MCWIYWLRCIWPFSGTKAVSPFRKSASLYMRAQEPQLSAITRPSIPYKCSLLIIAYNNNHERNWRRRKYPAEWIAAGGGNKQHHADGASQDGRSYSWEHAECAGAAEGKEAYPGRLQRAEGRAGEAVLSVIVFVHIIFPYSFLCLYVCIIWYPIISNIHTWPIWQPVHVFCPLAVYTCRQYSISFVLRLSICWSCVEWLNAEANSNQTNSLISWLKHMPWLTLVPKACSAGSLIKNQAK